MQAGIGVCFGLRQWGRTIALAGAVVGVSASAIAGDLKTAFETFCGEEAAEVPDAPLRPDCAAAPAPGLPATFRSIL